MAIAIGDSIPNATFTIFGENGPESVESNDYFAGKTVVLFAVPGAFTPTCNNDHLPGYLENIELFKAKGVDKIAVTAVNDIFVLNAWANASGGAGKIDFLADGSHQFASAIGMELDAAAFGMGTRSQRYSMLVENGVVKQLNLEDVPSSASASGAAAILQQI